jgi:hypothetical protein
MKRLLSYTISAVTAALLSVNCALSGYAEDSLEYGVFDDDSIVFNFDDAENFSLNLPTNPGILSNYSSDSYIYRDFLDSNNTAVYDALADWVTPSEDIVSVKLPETISVTLSALPGTSSFTTSDSEALSTAVFAGCKSGIDCVLFDMPEIFWLDTSKLSINFDKVTYSYSNRTKKYTFKITTLTFTPAIIEGLGDLDTALKYKDTLDEAIENFQVEGDTLYDQLKSIHDTISLFTYYDTNAAFASSALGSLVEPGVVCEGYSKGFKLICDRLGIPCVLIFGNYNESENTAHMWDYVKMDDGEWYAIDVTWDDLDGKNGQEIKYDYFLKGSDSFFTNHTEGEDYAGTILSYPVISVFNYQSDCEIEPTTEVTEPTTAATEPTTVVTEPTTVVTEPTTVATEPTTVVTEPTTAAKQLHGDYNNDGVVNAADMVICSNNLLGKGSGIFCDFDEDGEFDSLDLVAMRKFLCEE